MHSTIDIGSTGVFIVPLQAAATTPYGYMPTTYLPVKVGFLLSTKAAMPSIKSFVSPQAP